MLEALVEVSHFPQFLLHPALFYEVLEAFQLIRGKIIRRERIGHSFGSEHAVLNAR